MVGQYLIQKSLKRTSTAAGTGNADVGRNVHYLTNLSLIIEFENQIGMTICIPNLSLTIGACNILCTQSFADNWIERGD